jgi:flagellin-like hook-associated protein FlgL
MEKVFVAQQVAKKLFETEAAVDTALVEASELMSQMLKARQDVSASMVFADSAQAKLMEAIKALSEARSSMVAVHLQLDEARLRLGVRTKMSDWDVSHKLVTKQDEVRMGLREVG